MWAALTSPEAAAAVITVVGALLAAYWGGRAGGRGAVAAAQTQNRGTAAQGAINARRVVYAEFARDARALADGVHQYVMGAGPQPRQSPQTRPGRQPQPDHLTPLTPPGRVSGAGCTRH
jgi:hypothetical protein